MPEHRFHTPEPVELEIKIPAGDIDIETVEGDESFVSLDGVDKLLELTEVRQEGRRIVVELKGKKPFGLTISIGDFNFGPGGLRVRARVPHGSTTNLNTVVGRHEAARPRAVARREDRLRRSRRQRRDRARGNGEDHER